MISRQTFPTAELLNNFLTANDGKWYGLVEPGGFQWVVVSMDATPMRQMIFRKLSI